MLAVFSVSPSTFIHHSFVHLCSGNVSSTFEKLALFVEVHIAECFLVGLSYDGQELEQGEPVGVGKELSARWIRIVQ